MDRIGADFFRAVDMIKDRLDALPAVVQLPIGAEGHFRGCVDLIGMKALVWEEGMGEKWEVAEIPADLQAQAAEYRHQLVDVLVDVRREHHREVRGRRGDHGRRPPQGAPHGHDRQRRGAGAVRLGVQEQGRAAAARRVVDFLPSPVDLPPMTGIDIKGIEELERPAEDSAPFSALAFKIMRGSSRTSTSPGRS